MHWILTKINNFGAISKSRDGSQPVPTGSNFKKILLNFYVKRKSNKIIYSVLLIQYIL